MRFHDLDALRAFAMLLGIVLHTVCFLLFPGIMDWPVRDAWADNLDFWNNPYVYVAGAIHSFRMPLFFLISGFFTAMFWQSRGLRELVRHRLKRIGLPLLVACVTIIPVTNAFYVPATSVSWTIYWDYGFAHIWFLWYLILIVGVFVVCVRLGLRFRHPAWWLLLPVSILPEYVMQDIPLGPDLNVVGLLPAPDLFGYYLIFYVFGAFFWQNSIEVKRWWCAALVPVFLLPLTLIYLALTLFESGNPSEGLDPESFNASFPMAVGGIAYTWSWCFGLMGLFRWVASKHRYWVRYLSDASYWMYLLHLPLVYLAQMAVVPWPVSPHLKVLIVFVGVTAVLLATYHLFVRYTPIGTMLNGPRVRPAANA